MAINGDKPPLMGFKPCRITNQEDYEFTGYASSLTEIERLTGITFFPDASDAMKAELDGYSSRSIWKVDSQFLEKPCGEDASE